MFAVGGVGAIAPGGAKLNQIRIRTFCQQSAANVDAVLRASARCFFKLSDFLFCLLPGARLCAASSSFLTSFFACSQVRVCALERRNS
jgi:hypothetical protein